MFQSSSDVVISILGSSAFILTSRQPSQAPVSRTKTTLTAAGAASGRISSRSCSTMAYQSKGVHSSGVLGLALSDFPCWHTACARRSALPTSIPRRSRPAGARSPTIACQIALRSIARTTWATYRPTSDGISSFPTRRTSSTSISAICAHMIRTGGFTGSSSGPSHLFSGRGASSSCRKTMPVRRWTRSAP